MSRIVRLSLTLMIALMMVVAFAGSALAFEPPGKSGLTAFDFPAINNTDFTGECGVGTTMPNTGPWNASVTSPRGSVGPIPLGCPT